MSKNLMNKAKTPPAKRRLQSSSEDEDFCIICLQTMPKKLTKQNSVKCAVCERPVHLRCAKMYASGFTCEQCESEYEEPSVSEHETDE